jgi:hypothetical protein
MRQDNPISWAVTSVGDGEAVQHLKQAIASGKPWHVALLEAIGLWSWPEESRGEHHYCYLIDGEAFDWLLLAQRLCTEVDGLIPEEELIDLLFFGRMPGELSEDDFRRLIGAAKYHAYLNYFYGVIVEKFILLAVEEEIYKECQTHVFSRDKSDIGDSYQRVYGASRKELLRLFREDKGYPQSDTITLSQLHEFTYWLFKYRIAHCDKPRVASDTKKGLEYLRRQFSARGLGTRAGKCSKGKDTVLGPTLENDA